MMTVKLLKRYIAKLTNCGLRLLVSFVAYTKSSISEKNKQDKEVQSLNDLFLLPSIMPIE